LNRSVSTFVTLQALPPPVGFVELTTFPALSTATHSDVEGHDTPLSAPGHCAVEVQLGSTEVTVHALVSPVGSVEVSTLPAVSTATHNDCDGHETAVRSGPQTPGVEQVHVSFQALRPPVGFVEL
jgi:hypothetical protein